MKSITKNKLSTSLFILILISSFYIPNVFSWSNGGYSEDPTNPDYGTHDWLAQHALDWLPSNEKQYIENNLATYLYGTELPDNGQASDGIGDTTKHHIYYFSNGTLQDDSSAVRAYEEYNMTLSYLDANDFVNAAKHAGTMIHYIADMGVFGHVMGSYTDWGAEQHHSDYERYVNTRTNSYNDDFNIYLSYDNNLDTLNAYDAAIDLAYDTTFDVNGDLTCLWMDQNYDWSDSVFKDRCGESLNLAVNYLTDVLHTLYVSRSKISSTISCSLSSTSLTTGSDLMVSGGITPTHSGVQVTLSYTMPDGTFVERVVTSASDGSYSDIYTPSVAGSWSVKASWEGDSTHAEASSSLKSFTVKMMTVLYASVTSTEITEGSVIIVTGSINPALSGKTITFTYKKPDETTFNRTAITGPDGSYSDSYTPDAKGSWSVSTSWEGDSIYEGASSLSKSFTVQKKSGCLIATATYGSELSPQVQFLREFRDNKVLTTFAGSNFMAVFNDFYYSFSPSVASTITSNNGFKGVMKVILYPLIGILHFSSTVFSLFNFSPELGVVTTGLVASTLIAVVYVMPWVLLLSFLKKFKLSKRIIHWTTLVWVSSIVLIALAEATTSSLLMKASAGTFVLTTICLTTLTSTRAITIQLAKARALRHTLCVLPAKINRF